MVKKVNKYVSIWGQGGHFRCEIGHFNGKNYYIEDILRSKRTFYETEKEIQTCNHR